MNANKHCGFTYHSFFYSKGNVAQCCMQSTLTRQLDWQSVHNLDSWYQSLSEFDSVRTALDQGVEHPACKSCWYYEADGVPSARTQNLYYSEHTPSTKVNIRHVDLRLSNKCNLQCKMCSPGDSDQLVKLSDQLDIAGIDNPYKKLLPKNSNTDTVKLLDLILELPELEAIRFAGGEPFIMPEVEQFLHRLVAHGRTNVSIEFVTNCTSAKPKLIELLEQFNHVELMCSIDGVGSTLEYQRYPAKWSVIENNFKRMYESKCNTRIVPCIGLLNANDLVNFFAWAEQYERSLITYNEIQEPSFLDFRLVPLEHRVFLKDVSKNSVAPSWDHYIDELQYQVREPTLEESNELKQYASAWDYRSTEKFLDRYPWANYIIEKANI